MRLFSSQVLQRILAGAMTLCCLTLLLSACGSSPTAVQPPPGPSLSSELDAFLRSEVTSQQFRGSVLMARKGTLLLSKGYGMAHADQALANAPATMFGLGSVTKEFTAMATLILQERGKLHIHDPICTYLPPCPHAWQPITIFHLLTHSSGIPNHFERGGISLTQLEKEPLDFQPGTQYTYSNSGYVVLATILEKVSGQAYGTFLQQNIFAPLQMRHTGYDFTHPHLSGEAVGYSAWQVKVDDKGISLEVGADGLYSTVEDLYRWDQAVFGHTQTLVSEQALNEMFTNMVALCPTVQIPTCSSQTSSGSFRLPPPPTYAFLRTLGYGYGWFIATVEGSPHPIIYHAGATFGFRAYNAFYSEDNLTIIILSNLETVVPRDIAQILQQMVVVSGR